MRAIPPLYGVSCSWVESRCMTYYADVAWRLLSSGCDSEVACIVPLAPLIHGPSTVRLYLDLMTPFESRPGVARIREPMIAPDLR